MYISKIGALFTIGAGLLVSNLIAQTKRREPTIISTASTSSLDTSNVVLEWDYSNKASIIGFNIYKRTNEGNNINWVLVGQVSSDATSFKLPIAYPGVYAVTAFSKEFETEKSNELLILPKLTLPSN